MIGNVISKRYATALFNLGFENGLEQAELFGQNLMAISSAVSENKKLQELFESPIISDDEKKKVISGLLKTINGNETVKRFFNLLADRKRLSQVVAIAEDYKTMLDNAKGISQGKIITAISLDSKHKSNIQSQMEKQSNRKLELEFAVDPAILGGVVLNIGQTVFDASLRAQLNNLREHIKRGE